jgi:rhodanese-related sulfurtransferase
MAAYDRDEAHPYATIGTEEAKQMIDAGTTIIDVRRPEEWSQGHIPQAHHIPVEAGIYAFGKALQDLNLPPQEDVIFVCRSGQRSQVACEIALVAGLQRVYNLGYGMIGWADHEYPMER